MCLKCSDGNAVPLPKKGYYELFLAPLSIPKSSKSEMPRASAISSRMAMSGQDLPWLPFGDRLCRNAEARGGCRSLQIHWVESSQLSLSCEVQVYIYEELVKRIFCLLTNNAARCIMGVNKCKKYYHSI